MGEPVVVAEADELPPGEGMAVSVDGEAVALFNVDGAVHAIANACTHVGGSLGNGTLSGSTVRCPLHGATFDVAAGEVLSPPAREPVGRYEVEVVDGEVRLYR